MPDWKQIVRARVVAAGIRADRVPDDLVDELAQHAEEAYRSARVKGKGEEESRASVEAELHDLPALVRAARQTRARRIPLRSEPVQQGRLRLFSIFARDVAHGGRLLLARPVFTAIAVLTLALGIGANTAIFSVVYSLFLAPLPFPEPNQLVMLWEQDVERRDQRIVSAPNWEDWRAHATSFLSIAIWEQLTYNVAGGPDPEQVGGMRVSAGAFPMFGVAPEIGRTFTEDEELPGHRVVVISHSLWERRFSARPDVIGESMKLNGEPYEVIGVMPRTFQFLNRNFDVWVPIAFNDADDDRGSHSFFAAARLKAGVSYQSAQSEMEALGKRLEEANVGDKGHYATITRMDGYGVAYLRPTLTALVGAVAVVLLIACVNVANLLLAQATGRQREFTIRSALGASRGRVASQLLAEGLLLALIGGAAGVLVAWAGATAFDGSLPGNISGAPFRQGQAIGLNMPVLTFTSGLALITGLLFSLAPMLGVSRIDPGTTLKSGGDRGGTSRFTMVRTTLVGVEVALAVIVLAAAGLMIKSVTQLLAVNPGVDARNVLLMSIALPQKDFYGPPVRTSFCADVEREVSSLPGVRSVAAMSHLPFEGNAGRGFGIEGRPAPPEGEGASANYRLTCPGYFGTLGIPLTSGRDFTHSDSTTGPGVVIINEETAKRYWPGANPIGQRIRIGASAPWLTIVGIVANVRHFGLDNAARREIYRPYSQAAWPVMTVTVKTAVEPMTLASPVRSALARIDPEQPVSRIRTMERVVSESVGGRRFPMQLLGLFSVVALLLAAIGVYGVVSYLVTQRTREIGIRVALGARKRQVIRLVVLRSLVPIVTGLVVGVAGAIAASRLLGTLLYEVKPTDPVVLGSIVALLGTAAIVASFIPARKAAGVDPIVVLRQE